MSNPLMIDALMATYFAPERQRELLRQVEHARRVREARMARKWRSRQGARTRIQAMAGTAPAPEKPASPGSSLEDRATSGCCTLSEGANS
jgi:hypothetical protein